MIEKPDVDKAVVNFCMEVIQEPFIFFNESDLHLLLVEKLYEEFPSLKMPEHETNLNPSDDAERRYRTRLLHREYGGDKDRALDIVIFDEGDVEYINHPHLTKEDSKDYLSPLFAFELGICRDVKTHITNDINKLMRCKDEGVGYIIHIYRNKAVTRSDKQRSNNTEDKIGEKLKRPIEAIIRSIPSNIKIVAIILNPIREKEEKWTQCEIFDKHKKEENMWKGFNEEAIQDGKTIEELLESQLQ
jgi:hypothetical protein